MNCKHFLPFCGLSFHILLKQFLFICILGCAGSSLPHRLFSGRSKQGYSRCAAWAPVRVCCCGARTLEFRLSSGSTRAQLPCACGIFPDQGSNPHLLHWQVESLLLSHQGSPCLFTFLMVFFEA